MTTTNAMIQFENDVSIITDWLKDIPIDKNLYFVEREVEDRLLPDNDAGPGDMVKITYKGVTTTYEVIGDIQGILSLCFMSETKESES